MVVRSDAEARALIEPARRTGSALPALGLLGGDLCRTLGGLGDEADLRSAEAMSFPIDLGVAELDGERHWFVAHVIARRSWWRGRAVAAMNAQWLGDWDLGPRAHPDDGLLDVTDGVLPRGRPAQGPPAPPHGHPPAPSGAGDEPACATSPWRSIRPSTSGSTAPGSSRTRRLRLGVEPDALLVVDLTHGERAQSGLSRTLP